MALPWVETVEFQSDSKFHDHGRPLPPSLLREPFVPCPRWSSFRARRPFTRAYERDFALHPFDQRFSRASKLISFNSFFLWWLLRMNSALVILFLYYIPPCPPSRPKLSAYGLRPIAHNKLNTRMVFFVCPKWDKKRYGFRLFERFLQ